MSYFPLFIPITYRNFGTFFYICHGTNFFNIILLSLLRLKNAFLLFTKVTFNQDKLFIGAKILKEASIWCRTTRFPRAVSYRKYRLISNSRGPQRDRGHFHISTPRLYETTKTIWNLEYHLLRVVNFGCKFTLISASFQKAWTTLFKFCYKYYYQENHWK